MSYIEVTYPDRGAKFYQMLREQLELYTCSEPDLTSVLANASSVIAQAFPKANWVGFYLIDKNELKLGPFQGRPAVMRIGYGCGVCGSAWKRKESIVVDEVECFEGHIACDCNTHSEIVVPLRSGGEIWGVLDMDSVLPAHFTEEDRIGLEGCVDLLSRPKNTDAL